MPMPRGTSKLPVAILAALSPTVGTTPRQIHARCADWGIETVKNELRLLVEEGAARFEGPQNRRVYFRVSDTRAEPMRRSA